VTCSVRSGPSDWSPGSDTEYVPSPGSTVISIVRVYVVGSPSNVPFTRTAETTSTSVVPGDAPSSSAIDAAVASTAEALMTNDAATVSPEPTSENRLSASGSRSLQ
jgi:hypothetical protein